jgi:hypothetical protein
MGFIYVGPLTTYCADTPQNRREFEVLKAKIIAARYASKKTLRKQKDAVKASHP